MKSMDQDRLVAAVRSATEKVFSTMLGIAAVAEPAYVEQGSSQPFDGVIALVGLAGAWAGSGRISCPAALACHLSGALLATEYTAVNDDVLDAMSELTNMIIGNVKSSFEEDLGPMGLSIPTVIFGRNYRTRSCGAGECVVVPFRCGSELMDVRIELTSNGRTETARLAVQEAS